MEDSILQTIKKLIGFDRDYTVFDTDLIVHINSALSIIYQLGVGDTGFKITGYTETWEDLLGKDEDSLEMVKTYIYEKVKPIFDPPNNSFLISMYKEDAKELEWRINAASDPAFKAEDSEEEE